MQDDTRYRSNTPKIRLVDVFANECCHPSCDMPAWEHLATQVPLCERHIFNVYKTVNRFLTEQTPKSDEYALLPMEQDRIPGPCPSCGHAGYLTISSITERVRCLNASCGYEAHVIKFEYLRRGLLFDLAGYRNVVYYIKFRDCVKIGTSRDLRSRWRDIASTEMLYGFEWGDRRLERKRHEQFRDYRRTGEWFEDNCHIRSHINKVCVTA